MRSASVQAAESDHRVGVRPDQDVPRDRPVPTTWSGELPVGVEGDLRDAQPAEAVAERAGPPEPKGVRPGRKRFDAGKVHGHGTRGGRSRIKSDRAPPIRTFVNGVKPAPQCPSPPT